MHVLGASSHADRHLRLPIDGQYCCPWQGDPLRGGRCAVRNGRLRIPCACGRRIVIGDDWPAATTCQVSELG